MAYVEPTAADLIERYPAFANVDEARVDYWLLEAASECPAFPDADRARAEMAYAAHLMVETGTLASAMPSGLTSFKSGDFAATVDSAVAARTGLSASVYGREFLTLRRRAFAGGLPAWTPPDV